MKNKSNKNVVGKAFAIQNVRKAQRAVRRTLDKQTVKDTLRETHGNLNLRKQFLLPPLVVSIVGPANSGKTTLLNGLLQHFTKLKVRDVRGPVNIVTGKRRKLTFFECPNSLSAMIDIAKVSDFVVLTINAKRGLEMATLECLELLKVHGIPRVIAVFTHMDQLRLGKSFKNAKKIINKRIKVEGLHIKSFYMVSVKKRDAPRSAKQQQNQTHQQHCEYLRNDIKNLALFLRQKTPLIVPFRTTHPYVLVDRMEHDKQLDTHSNHHNNGSVNDNENLLEMSFYGYVRGCNWPAVCDSLCGIHLMGVGDFYPHSVTQLDDPCPSPAQETLLHEAAMAAAAAGKSTSYAITTTTTPKHRQPLRSSQRRVYAPMSGLGAMLQDEQGNVRVVQVRRQSCREDEEAAEQDGEENEQEREARHYKEWNEVEQCVDKMGLDDDDDGGDDDDENEIEEKKKKENVTSMFDQFKDLLDPNRSMSSWERLVYGDGDGEAKLDDKNNDDDDNEEQNKLDDNNSFVGGLLKRVKHKQAVRFDEQRIASSTSVGGGGGTAANNKGSGGGGVDWTSESERRKIKDLFATGEYSSKEKASEVLVRNAKVYKDAGVQQERCGEDDNDDDAEEVESDYDEDAEDRDDFDSEDSSSSGSSSSESDDEKKPKNKDAKETPKRKEKVVPLKKFEKKELKRARRKMNFNKVLDSLTGGGSKAAGEGGGGESGSRNVSVRDFINRKKALQEERRERRESAFNELAEERPEEAALLRGHPAGSYVVIVVRGVPAEFVRHHVAQNPIVIGCLTEAEQVAAALPSSSSPSSFVSSAVAGGGGGGAMPTMSLLQANFNMHKDFRVRARLRSGDPIIVSLDWRRIETVATFFKETHDHKKVFSKYSSEGVEGGQVVFQAPLAAPKTGFVALHSMDNIKPFRICGVGSILGRNESILIEKSVRLVGYPYEIKQKTAFIHSMFSSAVEASKFEGAIVKTTSNIRGIIKNVCRPTSALQVSASASNSRAKNALHDSKRRLPEGSVRCTFEAPIVKADIVFLPGSVHVDLVKFWRPIRDRLLSATTVRYPYLPTRAQARRDGLLLDDGDDCGDANNDDAKKPGKKGAGKPQKKVASDSQYQTIERKPFEPTGLLVPEKIRAALPFRTKQRVEQHDAQNLRLDPNSFTMAGKNAANSALFGEAPLEILTREEVRRKHVMDMMEFKNREKITRKMQSVETKRADQLKLGIKRERIAAEKEKLRRKQYFSNSSKK